MPIETQTTPEPIDVTEPERILLGFCRLTDNARKVIETFVTGKDGFATAADRCIRIAEQAKNYPGRVQ